MPIYNFFADFNGGVFAVGHYHKAFSPTASHVTNIGDFADFNGIAIAWETPACTAKFMSSAVDLNDGTKNYMVTGVLPFDATTFYITYLDYFPWSGIDGLSYILRVKIDSTLPAFDCLGNNQYVFHKKQITDFGSLAGIRVYYGGPLNY